MRRPTAWRWLTPLIGPAGPCRWLGALVGCPTAPAAAAHLLVAGLARGPFLLWPRTRPEALRTTHTDPLPPRERGVLEEPAQGHTNAAIAGRLHISQSAVEKHLNAVFDKLDLNRADGYNRRVLAVLRCLEA